jgi:hypothetical protein
MLPFQVYLTKIMNFHIAFDIFHRISQLFFIFSLFLIHFHQFPLFNFYFYCLEDFKVKNSLFYFNFIILQLQ